MPYADMREWIAKLDEQGQLARITAEVDWDNELGAVMRRAWDTYGDACPALLFENIKDYKAPGPNKVFVGSLQTYSRYALMLDLPAVGNYPNDLVKVYTERSKNTIKPNIVSTGPCKENIQKGDDIDIWKLPIPLWNRRDGGRYIGVMHACIAKDPDTGWVNVGCYRMMAKDKNTCIVSMTPGIQHIGYIYAKYIERNEPMPLAVTIGQDPSIMIAAGGQAPVGVSEWDFSGGIRGAPIDLVKCETVDLEVPATAEIVLEGTVDPRERIIEGPFGEYTGYYGSVPAPKPVMHLSCVTYRNDPIFQGTCEGYPVDEDHMLSSVTHSAHILGQLEKNAIAGVREVACPVAAGAYGEVIVSIKPMYDGHEDHVAAAIFSSSLTTFSFKMVIVVDEDIDPWNYEQVHWSLWTRTDWNDDIKVWKDFASAGYDPRSEPGPKKRFWSKVLIKSTRPYHWSPRSVWGTDGIDKGVPLKYPPIVRPAPDMMRLINKKWDGYGIKPSREYVGKPVGPFMHFWRDDIIDKIEKLKMHP